MSDFSLEQVSNVISVTDGRLKYWQKIGLFPRRREGYDWADLQRAKLLNRLTEEGVPASRLVPFAPLLEGHELHSSSRALVVDDEEGPREVESGQYLLEFQAPTPEHETAGHRLHYLPQLDLWERQAQEALESGDHERALEIARGALQSPANDDYSSLNNIGLVFLELKQGALAVEALQRACQTPYAGARQWFNLSHAYEATGDLEASLDALEQALEIDPDFSAARFNLAYNCESLGHTGRAFLHWKAFLERHPEADDADRVRKHVELSYSGVVPLRSSL